MDARAEYKRHFLPTAQIKDYIVTIDWQNFFNKPVKNDLKTYENIQKITIGHRDNYTTACLLNFCFFKENHNLKHLMLIRKQCTKLILLEI